MPEPKIIHSKREMKSWARSILKADQSLGLVPTMGALHQGHRVLVERARAENNRVAVSIFVNPTQFGPGEDFSVYPRTLEEDARLCGEAGADVIFAPEADEMYIKDARTWVEVYGLTDNLCGLSRPGHFRGVATVVAKLLNIVQPDRAYFGRKDAQQLRVIQTMVRDLDLGVTIVPCETIREIDGLAVSSRNAYLTSSQRKQALSLYEALEHCRSRVNEGERKAMTLLGEMADLIAGETDTEIDYIAIVDAENLEDVEELSGEVLVALAVKVGDTRLIDNISMKV